MVGNIKDIESMEFKDLTIIDDFLKCDCHWSTIEIETNELVMLPRAIHSRFYLKKLKN